jgi:phosphoribosylformimino-5-aminoimidazole carboxamide ribotide isomerase
MPLRVIPVLDVKQGVAVHAIGGERAQYRPIRSALHAGSDPLGLAQAYREILGLDELYLADLDAIAGAPAVVRLYAELSSLGIHAWVDAGVRDASMLGPLLDAGVGTVVAGLETLGGPAALRQIVEQVGPDRLVFSLDLRSGVAQVAEGVKWSDPHPLAIAARALDLGVRRLLLLDLARVGRGDGTGTGALLAALTTAHPEVEIAVGGGVAGVSDLHTLAAAGASAVLVGSALHDGRISGAEIASACEPRGTSTILLSGGPGKRNPPN